ncbi:MAG: ABC transporter substrate-binding protein [bacterium]|nr:ABC transporter substrate-binding protein [bacterium]
MKRTSAVIMVIAVVICLIIGATLMYSIPQGEVIVKDTSSRESITILAGQSTPDAGTEEMIQKVLSEKFPDVDIEWICVGWSTDNYQMRLTGRYAVSNAPDIIIGKAQDAIGYAESGVLLPIDEACAEGIREDELNAVRHNGALYAIPYTCQYQGVFYNKAVFDKYGLVPPRSLGELARIVKILEDYGETPFAAHFQEDWQVGNMTMQFMMNEVFNHDEHWGDGLRNGTNSYQNNEAVKQCFINSQYILEHTWEDALQIDQFECDERFGKGSAAMYLTGSWSLQSISQVIQKPEIGIFPYPNSTGDPKLVKEVNISFMKGARTQHSELVDLILKEIAGNQELAKGIADFTKGESTLESLRDYKITEVQEDTGKYENVELVTDVTVGNNQLIWDYQESVASEELNWLKGQKTLEQVLEYADQNAKNSIAER